jgi:hypothetical protein
VTGTVVAFRIADWASPLRVNPSRHAGRYHRLSEVTQYLSIHPLGPYAEYLRREQPAPSILMQFRHRLWALRVPLDAAVEITWDNAAQYGIRAHDLVADEHEPCRQLAARLQAEGVDTIVVPSAALPGTKNVIVFGPRVPLPYTARPRRRTDVPAAVAAEDATIPETLLTVVRRVGERHPELTAWKRGETYQFIEPDPAAPAF